MNIPHYNKKDKDHFTYQELGGVDGAPLKKGVLIDWS